MPHSKAGAITDGALRSPDSVPTLKVLSHARSGMLDESYFRYCKKSVSCLTLLVRPAIPGSCRFY